MSQQTSHAEKNLAEGSAAIPEKEIVSITTLLFYFYYMYLLFSYFSRKLAPTPPMMRKMVMIKPSKEHQLHHPPHVTM